MKSHPVRIEVTQVARILGFAASLAASSGCATSATALKPGSLSSDEGALFGQITVYNLGADVTAHCYVELTDEAKERQRYLSLDKTGWVFASVKPGTTYLSFVSCTVTDGTTFNVQHQTRELSFAVPGSGRIAYFGHVSVEFDAQGQNLLEATFTPPLLADYGERAPGPYVEVYDRFAEAVREYNARYGNAAAHLKPTLALLPLTLKKGATPSPALTKKPPSPARAPAAPSELDLMPASDLSGWRRVPIEPLADKAVWSQEQKLLVIDGIGAKEMLLYETELGDGVLHVEWRFRKSDADKPVYNGGVYVRTALDGKSWVQLQVAHQDKPPIVGDLIAQASPTAQRVTVVQDEPSPANPIGEWNTYDITTQGKSIEIVVNGKRTARWTDCPMARGHVGLQAEGGIIEVRALRFRPL